MIINLGLVELGGETVDGVELAGYIFKFADKDHFTGDIRTWSSIKKLTMFYHHIHPEVRVFINYDSPECVALATKYLTMFRNEYNSISLIFPSGNIVIIK